MIEGPQKNPEVSQFGSSNAAPGQPEQPIPTSELPFPLTFFLTAAQRAAVLRKLSTLHEDRVAALLLALELTTPTQ